MNSYAKYEFHAAMPPPRNVRKRFLTRYTVKNVDFGVKPCSFVLHSQTRLRRQGCLDLSV